MYQAPPPEPQEVLELTVSDLLKRWPAAFQVLLAYRLGCIGCVYSRFDTLQEALDAQGVNESQFIPALLRAMSDENGVDAQ